jgi:hypothetical protein
MPTAVSLSSVVAICVKNAYLEELLEELWFAIFKFWTL